MVAIPAALKPYATQELWVCWKFEPTNNKDKPTKVPYQAKAPTKNASTSDPSTWADAPTALSAKVKYDFDGIGICLSGTNLVALT
jgi:primase-polymerase (primpol)-like protein